VIVLARPSAAALVLSWASSRVSSSSDASLAIRSSSATNCLVSDSPPGPPHPFDPGYVLALCDAGTGTDITDLIATFRGWLRLIRQPSTRGARLYNHLTSIPLKTRKLPPYPAFSRSMVGDLLDGKTARVMGGFRMIGNSEIRVASSARRLGHGAQRIDTIGQVRMGVQNAADILVASFGSLRFSANWISPCSVELRDFRHQRQVGDQFATAGEVAGRRNAYEAGVRPPQIRFGRFEQGRSAMQMALALPAPFDVDALKDLALQRCAQALHVLEAVLPRRLLQSFERSNAELAIKFEHFLPCRTSSRPIGRSTR
jgi:hypothetical protein